MLLATTAATDNATNDNNYNQELPTTEPKSSQASTTQLNGMETPVDRVRQLSKESTERWSHKRASGSNAPQKMPPLRQVHKQQSLEQLRIMKEHQKIRDFFSKESEEKDGKTSFSQLQKKMMMQDKTQGRLPMVNKNVRLESSNPLPQFHHVPTKVSKKAMSLISRHYQKGDSFANSSLFSESSRQQEESGTFEMKNKADATKNLNKIVLQKLLKDKK